MAGTTTAAADSGGANVAYMATDSITGVPAAEDVIIVSPNQAGTLTVTMDGTQTCGVGTDTALVTRRSIGSGLSIYKGGVLIWDTVADADLTCKGNIVVGTGGELDIGTVGTPMPAARVGKLRLDENGTTTNHGIGVWDAGNFVLQGTPKSSTTLWKTKYASGSGTAADPLITLDPVDWVVGDQILIAPTSNNATNYNETEYKFVIAKVANDTFVLSDTFGGLEAALVNVHTTDAWILNLTRNVIIDTTDTTKGMYLVNNNLTPGSVNIDWARFENVGGATSGKQGVYIENIAGAYAQCDYSVLYNNFYHCIIFSRIKSK